MERFAEQNDAEVVLGEQRLLALRRQVEHERKQRMIETMLGESSRTCLLAEVQRAELETLAEHERQLAGVARLLGGFLGAAEARSARYAARAAAAEPRGNVAPGDGYLQGLHAVLAGQQLPVQACLAVLQQHLGAGGAAAAADPAAAALGTPPRAPPQSPLRQQHQHQHQPSPKLPGTPAYLPVQALAREVAAAAGADQQAHWQLQQLAGAELAQQEQRLKAEARALHERAFLQPGNAAPALTEPQLRRALEYLNDMSTKITEAIQDAGGRFQARAQELERKPHLQEQRRVLQLMMSDVSALPALLARANEQAERLEAQRAYL